MLSIDKQKLLDDNILKYKAFAEAMMGKDSIQSGMIAEMLEQFNTFGLDTAQMGEAMVQLVATTSASFNKDAMTAATDFDYKEAQVELLKRQEQGYDDNMLLKIVEHQSGLASFAVNAGSDTAQSAIDALKDKMAAVEMRVKLASGGPNCPTIPRVVPVPTNFRDTTIAATEVDLAWDGVVDATQYVLYRDGVEIATNGALTFKDTGLTTATKYAYTLKAMVNNLESNNTKVLIVTTA